MVLCIGHRLNGIPNLGYTFPSKKQKFIHVLPDGKDLENIFKTDHGIISDGNDFMEKLLKVKIQTFRPDKNCYCSAPVPHISNRPPGKL